MPKILNLTEEERIARRREQNRKAHAKYRKTPKGKATQKRFLQSEKGKEYARKKKERYINSEKGKATIKKYSMSEKRKESSRIAMAKYYKTPEGKAKRKAYAQSEAGKQTMRRYKQSEKGKAKEKAYRNTEKRKIYRREYKKTDKYRVWERENSKKKYENNLQYKLTKQLRVRLNSIFKDYKAEKKARFVELLGCDIKYFFKYMENKFEEGMTWENHGFETWLIDHIIPIKEFDLTDLEEQKKCFHYTNLQPLWAKENLKKGTKIL